MRALDESPPAPVPRDRPLAPSFGQQRLWLLDRLEPDAVAYNTVDARRLRGPLDVAALRAALDRLVARHEALRTTFPERDGAPVQAISPPAPAPLRLIDGAGWGLAEIEGACRADARRRFDLPTEWPLRATLIELAPDDHVLLIVVHHIASDGWSKGILRRELASLYEAERRGEPASLPELPIQYADFAAWQRRCLEGPQAEEQLAWWRARLDGAAPAIELPLDHPRPAIQRFRGARHVTSIDAELLGALRTLAREERATLFMALLAGFYELLRRYGGQDDIVVGTPVAGRGRPELEHLIGYLGNTLPLRAQLRGEDSFRALLGRVRALAVDAYAHQEVPFERLVEALAPARDTARAPIFQVLFALHDPSASAGRLPGLEDTPLAYDPGWSKFDLTLLVAESGGGLTLTWEFATDLFEPVTVERIAETYRALLEAAVADPDRALEELQALPEAQRAQLAAWRTRRGEYPRERCLHELVAEQAARTPDAEAVWTAAGALTYAQIERRAREVAARLQALGVRAGEPVGVCLARSLHLVPGLLGTLESGAAYLPLDPAYPAERLSFMLADAGVRVILTERALLDALPEHELPTVCVDDRVSGDGEPARGTTGVGPESLAYVLYTSGSSGRPKGVMLPHRAAVNQVSWAGAALSAAELAGMLAATSLSWDLSVLELFAPLAHGGRVVLVDGPLALAELSPDAGVTLLNMIPSALAELLAAGLIPAGVRTVIAAGEPLPGGLVQALHERTGVTRVINAYGPTENGYTTVAEVPAGKPQPPIGAPLPNVEVRVADAAGREVPIGAVGELLIGGDNLARGYLGRPELTGERFVTLPDGLRAYRSGDLVRHRHDGQLVYLGRCDEQLKVRGFRIEPAEVESALCEHPGVGEAAVVASEDRRSLLAYVAPAEAGTAAELRAHLRSKLPAHLQPAAIVALARLPRLPNGKLDRRALPAPEGGQEGSRAEWVTPSTPVQAALAELFVEVLGVEAVSAEDGFFELGGHSLLAVRLIGAISERLGVTVPLRAVFEAPTVAALSERVSVLLLEEAGGEELEALLAELEPVEGIATAESIDG